jgi:hypothetical protein
MLRYKPNRQLILSELERPILDFIDHRIRLRKPLISERSSDKRSNIMESKKRFKTDSKLKSMDQVRQVLRYHHYAYQTEKPIAIGFFEILRQPSAVRSPD